MDLTLPIKLDSTVYCRTADGRTNMLTQLSKAHLASNIKFLDSAGVPTAMNAYDSSSENGGKGARLTNLTGTQGGSLLKRCPRCGTNLLFDAFGPLGRVTNEFRDQSNCPACRSAYT